MVLQKEFWNIAEKTLQRDDILIRNNRDPLFGYSREVLIDLFKQMLSGRVQKAYFFGSFTGNTFGPDSDIDLLLITDTDKPFVERPADFHDLLSIIPSLDILVYTPEEFKMLTKKPSAGFWQDVTATMKRFV